MINDFDRDLLTGMRKLIRSRDALVFVDLSGGRRIGLVTEINHKTTWVKIMMGAKTYIIIRRHNKKHNVVFHAFKDVVLP